MCEVPSLPRFTVIDLQSLPNSWTEGASITYHCVEGFIPNKSVKSICSHEGTWNPDPALHTCKLIQQGTYRTLAFTVFFINKPKLALFGVILYLANSMNIKVAHKV